MSAVHYAILRVERVKSNADLDGATRHGRRADSSTHFDPERSPFNMHWAAGRVTGPVDWAEAVQATFDRFGVTPRKNAPLAADFLVAASPEYFSPLDDTGHFNMERVIPWAEAVLAAFHERYPRMVAAARLDLDEGSPHMSICVVPIYTKVTKRTSKHAVSYRKVFGGETISAARDNMIGLQDWFAEKMAPLGLTRGVPKRVTGRSHESHQEYARRHRASDEAMERAKADAELYAAQLQERVAEFDIRLAALHAQEALLKTNLRKATQVLLDATKSHEWIKAAVSTLEAYDPHAPVVAILHDKQEVFDKHLQRISQLSADLDNIEPPVSSTKHPS